jgi:hypothetical protein
MESKDVKTQMEGRERGTKKQEQQVTAGLNTSAEGKRGEEIITECARVEKIGGCKVETKKKKRQTEGR